MQCLYIYDNLLSSELKKKQQILIAKKWSLDSLHSSSLPFRYPVSQKSLYCFGVSITESILKTMRKLYVKFLICHLHTTVNVMNLAENSGNSDHLSRCYPSGNSQH